MKLALTTVIAFFAAPHTPADDFTVDSHTTDGGGAMFTTAGDFELSGTIGQPDANGVVMAGGDFELSGGFWPGMAVVSIPGDYDGDGDVDLDDFEQFAGPCFGGPDAPVAPECAFADFDGDGDVDLYDFAAFQEAFTG